MPKPLTVSIVIPAYNEEAHIAACLDAVAAQTVKPFEVIVVDNNCSDATVAIVRRYPFVKVVREPRQGLVYARDCGFNAARGQIIGRLDCDSVIASNWVAKVQELFADEALDAVSGQISYRNIGLAKTIETIDKQVRQYLTRHMSALGEQFLYGSNMAIRRTVWMRVRGRVCHQQQLHEDIDLAAHLSHLGARVGFAPDLLASVDWRQAAAGPKQFWAHVWSSDRVFTEHHLKSRRYALQAILLVSSLYLPIHFLYKGYNPETARFSLPYLISNAAPVRISPVSDVA